MRTTLCVALTVLLAGACGPRRNEAGSGSTAVNRDTLTERQRDSIIGASRLPGARAVRRGLEAGDAAAAHNAAIDSANAAMER